MIWKKKFEEKPPPCVKWRIWRKVKRQKLLSRLLLLSSLVALGFFLKSPLLDLVIRGVLRSVISEPIQYEKSRFASGALTLYNVRYRNILVDRLVVQLNFQNRHLVPHFTLLQPEVSLGTGGEALDKEALLALFCGHQIDAKDGVIHLIDSPMEQLFFSFYHEQESGILQLAYGPEKDAPPFLQLAISQECAKLQSAEVPAQHLVHLAKLFCPDLEFLSFEGDVTLHAEVLFGEGYQIQEIRTELRTEQFFLEKEGSDLGANRLFLTASCPYKGGKADLPNLFFSLGAEGLHCHLQEPLVQKSVAVTEATVALSLEPGGEPTLLFDGTLFSLDTSFPVALTVTGTTGELKIDQAGSLRLSLIAQDAGGYRLDVKMIDELILTPSLQNLLPFSRQIEIQSAVVAGQATALFDWDGIKSLSLEKIVVRNLRALLLAEQTTIALPECRGSGSFVWDAGKWESPQFVLHFDHAKVWVEQEVQPLFFSNVKGEISLTTFLVEGDWNEIHAKLACDGSPWEGPLQLQLEGRANIFLKQFLNKSLPEFSSPVKVNATVIKGDSSYTLSGITTIGSDSFDFDLLCDTEGSPLFGSLSSSPLHSELYAPLLRWIDPSLGLKGSPSLLCKIDPQKIEWICHGSNLTMQQEGRLLELPSLGKNGAHLFYDRTLNRFSGTFPLEKVSFQIESVTGEDVSGTLQWVDGKLKGFFSHGSLALPNALKLQEVRGELLFDLRSSILQIRDLEAELCSHERIWKLSSLSIDSSPGKCHIDSEIDGVGSIVTTGILHGKEWCFAFDSDQTKLFGIHPLITEFRLDKNFSLQSLKMQPVFTAAQIPPIAQFFGIALPLMEGKLCAEIFYQNKELQIQASGSKLRCKNQQIEQFFLQLGLKEEMWQIKKLQCDALVLQAELQPRADLLHIPYCQLNYLNHRIHLAGDLFADCSDSLSLKGQLSGTAFLEPLKGLKLQSDRLLFSYTLEEGVQLEEASCSIATELGKRVGCVQLKGGELRGVSQLQFQLEPACLDALLAISTLRTHKILCSPVSGCGELFYQSGIPELKLQIDPLRIQWGENLCSFSESGFFYADKVFNFQSGVTYDALRCYLFGKINFNQEPSASLILQEDLATLGMKCLFKTTGKQFFLESVEGLFSGVQASIRRNRALETDGKIRLSGHLQVDGNRALRLFPKNIKELLAPYKVGRGYQLQGEIFLDKTDSGKFDCIGQVKGDEIDLFGLRLKNLAAKFEWRNDQLIVSDCTVRDPALILDCQELKIEKGREGDLLLNLPLLSLQGVRPSMLRSVSKTQKPHKPFLIRHLRLENIQGVVGNAKSFIGNGSLQFTNCFKKENSLLDIPFDLMRDVGLDLSLLTPIYGELDYRIQQGRVHFTALRNAYSEGKRSEFFLCEDSRPSSMDFYGNLSLNFKMKQNVLLKLGELFTLTVRGNLQKPEYGLER